MWDFTRTHALLNTTDRLLEDQKIPEKHFCGMNLCSYVVFVVLCNKTTQPQLLYIETTNDIPTNLTCEISFKFSSLNLYVKTNPSIPNFRLSSQTNEKYNFIYYLHMKKTLKFIENKHCEFYILLLYAQTQIPVSGCLKYLRKIFRMA